MNNKIKIINKNPNGNRTIGMSYFGEPGHENFFTDGEVDIKKHETAYAWDDDFAVVKNATYNASIRKQINKDPEFIIETENIKSLQGKVDLDLIFNPDNYLKREAGLSSTIFSQTILLKENNNKEKNNKNLEDFLYFIDTCYNNNGKDIFKDEYSITKEDNFGVKKYYVFDDKRNIDDEEYCNSYSISNSLITVKLNNTKQLTSPNMMNDYISDITSLINKEDVKRYIKK